MTFKVGASILTAQFSNLANEIKRVEEAGIDFIHFDVVDTSFANFITFGSILIRSLRNLTGIPFDVHCYVADPMKCIKRLIEAGANTVTVHVESSHNISHIIEHIKDLKALAGAALLPETSPQTIRYLLDSIDVVSIVSIDLLSFGKWRFIPKQLKKIKEVRSMIEHEGLNIDIQVDGGVNLKNVDSIIDAGANSIVTGSALFKTKDLRKTVTAFKNIAKKRN